VTEETKIATGHDFERLYREQGARLYHALLGFTGDKDVSRDAVAEASVRGISSTSEIRNPVPWLWRVGFRVAGDELKRRGKFAQLTDSEQAPPEPPELFAALARLSERQRAAVMLHYYAGYSLNEIAVILGMKKGTVGVHLHRGRARLEQILEVEDG
jgi:RNA polymerase sigma-70 factor (ECF subfamily)